MVVTFLQFKPIKTFYEQVFDILIVATLVGGFCAYNKFSSEGEDKHDLIEITSTALVGSYFIVNAITIVFGLLDDKTDFWEVVYNMVAFLALAAVGGLV